MGCASHHELEVEGAAGSRHRYLPTPGLSEERGSEKPKLAGLIGEIGTKRDVPTAGSTER